MRVEKKLKNKVDFYQLSNIFKFLKNDRTMIFDSIKGIYFRLGEVLINIRNNKVVLYSKDINKIEDNLENINIELRKILGYKVF